VADARSMHRRGWRRAFVFFILYPWLHCCVFGVVPIPARWWAHRSGIVDERVAVGAIVVFAFDGSWMLSRML
jgi:hypothetical protein